MSRSRSLAVWVVAASVVIGVAGSLAASPALGQARSIATVRQQADRMTARLGRATAGRSRAGSARAGAWLRSGYARLAGALVTDLEAQEQNATTSPQARLRAAGAVARAIRTLQRGRTRAEQGTLAGLEVTVDRLAAMLGRARYAVSIDGHETGVELEMRTRDVVLDALTTRDGSVGPVLDEGGQPAPDFLDALARAQSIAPREVRWDALTNEQKLTLLRAQSAGRDFFAGRRIPGVIFRRRIANTGAGGVTLRNREQTGADVDVDGVLLPLVEYRGPGSVEDVAGVEAHVRERGLASTALHDARVVARLLGSNAPAIHQHIPVHASPLLLRGDELERVRVVDFFRRVNMVAQLRMVLAGGTLERRTRGEVVFFDFLGEGALASLNAHLAQVGGARDAVPLEPDELKAAAVGFRTGEIYGDPGMFGFEIRTLTREYAGEPFVDAVQRGLLERSYGSTRASAARFVERALAARGNGRSVPRAARLARTSAAFEALNPNRELDEMLVDARRRGVEVSAAAEEVLRRSSGEHIGLKLLLHDFARDPVFDGQPDALGRVAVAQQDALRDLARGEAGDQVVFDFVRLSGLRGPYERSIGMTPPE